jgi:hypothetical protein
MLLYWLTIGACLTGTAAWYMFCWASLFDLLCRQLDHCCAHAQHALTTALHILSQLSRCRYEEEGRARKVVRAQQLWFAVLEAQIETGNPYMLYKDSCNRKSNQQNLGTIKCSNLCTEIVEYTSPEETAVCNLASIALPRFVREQGSQVRLRDACDRYAFAGQHQPAVGQSKGRIWCISALVAQFGVVCYVLV